MAGEVATREVGDRHRQHDREVAVDPPGGVDRGFGVQSVEHRLDEDDLGAAQLRPHLAALSAQADALVMAYPNAGLPNDLGEYDEAAAETAAQVREWLDDGLVNAVGGCCGTTPEHIAAIAAAVQGRAPRTVPQPGRHTLLAGLEPMVLAA